MNFNKNDANKLLQIIKSRRDVRGNRFTSQAVEEEKLQMILEAAIAAPSVGFSQPWKFVIIKNQQIKDSIYNNFVDENTKAKEIFKDKELYAKLKLEGIKEAPLNIAVLYEETDKEILGMTSMKKMGEYSVVCAIQNMWLMARALNIGLGWVSILNEKKVLASIHAPKNTKLIAYLCLGYVHEFLDTPELQTLEWETKKSIENCSVIL
ncbi:5,6-dimethylbenzimidazole synthase [Sulfurimonas sp. SAG-AH-194-I05]|nr:5,6-dimethylbenzimidazole synthase [Sulfurimonas sp. SAG-AH-194-I05]MDF1875307.1 5,6-dimethylbenzimidazole synthase [Sulfurimonas sp. SAG-AH-194-I05]